jgi:hypothetical protein
VGAKLRASATQCQSVLQAWARLEDNGPSHRFARSLSDAAKRASQRWSIANRQAAQHDAACTDMSLAGRDLASLLQDRAGDLAESLAGDGECSEHFLRAAADVCRTYLDAEARVFLHSNGDRASERRDRLRARTQRNLERRFSQARGCEAPMTPDELSREISNLTQDVVTATTISPGWTTIFPEQQVEYNGRVLEPICSGSTPYVFHARTGAVNKLVVYYEGGGACWDNFTCGGEPRLGIGPTFKQAAQPDEGPANFGTGFADLSNPDNPFRDWNIVYVPYCTGDVHWGDASVEHRSGNRFPVPIEHKGFVNAQVVEKWTREHFTDPEQVFVTGSSAGAYGAIVNSLSLIENVYPEAEFSVLGDAGNGVITRDFLENDIAVWGVEQNLPAWIPALNVPITELDAADLYVAAAQFYPQHRFATYTSAYDGGTGGQTGFFNIMRNIDAIPFWFNWWLASCDWNTEMRALNRDAASRAANFRFYVGTGSAHTMWGRDKVYTDTTGGVPTLVDWIRAMLDDTPAWVNVECQDCGVLLPGDPRPVPPVAPFSADGRIECP